MIRPPSAQEMSILSLLWEQGPLTARQVLYAMPDGKERAYTSILTVLQAMERKGFVSHTSNGVTNVYRAEVKQGETVGPMLRNLVRDVFQNSPSAAMQHLLQQTKVDDEEIQAMERLLKQHRKEKRGGDV
ncbi:MAG: BlaI/MecI/CopY family transcriptional regulator [Candidatus Hydrogenedentes bacterium]|nr:BlaI/MecI/CopY family transcriptional regulator [Candidatus Hydrogenedentota bacterium]